MARKAGPQRRTSGIRLIVADQNLMNCQLLVGALRRCRNIEVVARATSSDQILAEAKASQPSVALIGANLQEGSLTGFGAVRRLRTAHPEIRASSSSGFGGPRLGHRCFSRGSQRNLFAR